MASPTPTPSVRRYRGDDWTFSFTWQTGATPPVAIPLTGLTVGAELFVAYNPTPIPVADDVGSVTVVDSAAGTFAVLVHRTITGSVSADAQVATRLHVYVTDTAGNRTTIGVLPIRVVQP